MYKEKLMEQDDFDKGDDLSEMDMLKMEHKLLELAYENSYSILTKKITFDSLLDKNTSLGVSSLLAYDPESGVTKDEIENMIQFYVREEWFERCAELKKIMNRKYQES